MSRTPAFSRERASFHKTLLTRALGTNADGVPSIADKHSRASMEISAALLDSLGKRDSSERLSGQTAGNVFERACTEFLSATFQSLGHLRPGQWNVEHLGGNRGAAIADYEQYRHLYALKEAASKNRELAVALGSDYMISPDIVISRTPEPDECINQENLLVNSDVARLTPLRYANNQIPLLHATISCKWTVRSDRAQNARSEALNLVKNRKGRLPHVVVVTAEPLPSRISSLAMGTGEIDGVYHFALHELRAAVEKAGFDDALDMLDIMISGNRLRDIADLPLDLCI